MEAVYASGYVVAKDEYQITSQAEGYLSELLVKEGEEVKKGQPLFVMESRQQNARYAIARETYELALKNYRAGSPVLNELEAALASARSKMKFDSMNWVRYANLIQQKATTQIDADRMKLTYENSRNDYRLQTNRLEKTKNQVKLDYENAQRQLDIASEESGRYIVKSEMDGKLFTSYKEKNELVRRGEVLAVIGDAKNFYLKLSVDEMDVRKVTTGQEVLVKIDAFGEVVFKGIVNQIYPIINIREQSIRVDADFVNLNENLYSGLAVEANIVIQQKKEALVIPKKYLLEGDSVWTDAKGSDKKIKVKKGIETLDEVEILNGLSATDRLMVKK
jgi:HlyD family secretion protein